MMDISDIDKGELQELIATLYLRLNGYFTSGLILHHPDTGKNLSDVDVLAIRFPWHVQPDREVGPAPELNCSKTETDIVIGEVKSKGQPLQFNDSVRDSPEAVCRILQWTGAFEQQEITGLEPQVRSALSPGALLKSEWPTVQAPRSTRIRGVLFSPEYNSRRENQPWFLPGPPILDYLWRCLHPGAAPPSCSRRYDFGLWGKDLEPLVRYVKESAKPTTFKPFFEDFRKWVDRVGCRTAPVNPQA
jgi:hypothetical protein